MDPAGVGWGREEEIHRECDCCWWLGAGNGTFWGSGFEVCEAAFKKFVTVDVR